MKVGVIQSNYIPWKGYFDFINKVDLFIFHDDLQYTKQDWRNRNKIKTLRGETKWLSVPVGSSENRLIADVEIKDSSWQKKHWDLIYQNYKNMPGFRLFGDFIKDFYLGKNWINLSEMNQYFIIQVSKEILKINTKFEDSRKYHLKNRKQERVIELLKKCLATEYLSGPAAKSYIQEEKFKEEGFKLSWMEYENYPEYSQISTPFEHGVSIIDPLLTIGDKAVEYILT